MSRFRDLVQSHEDSIPDVTINDIKNKNERNNNDGQHRGAEINIRRQVINQKDLYSHYKGVELDDTDPRIASGFFGIPKAMKTFECSPIIWFQSLIPFFDWFPKYQWKEDLKNDIVAGFTVAVMHIPQGMAYALLANLPPIVGIYMAFFPVIIYTFLGTSRHGSIGTFAVVCLMTGKISADQMAKYKEGLIESPEDVTKTDLEEFEDGTFNTKYDVLEVTTAISMTVGLCQLLMGVFRLGRISLLLSPSLISGFTAGAAFHVFTSQVKNFFGLDLPKRDGFFNVPFTYADVIERLGSSNTAAMIMSITAILILVVYNEFLKVPLSKRIPFPIPVELMMVVAGTLISYFGHLQSKYNVSVIGDIPTGLPTPAVPPVDVIPDVFVGSLIISFVAYAISISMAKIFAEKHHYEVDANQELIALGSSNIAGSFFKCAPVSVSLARSLVQESVGGRTQLTGIFSCGVLLLVLLWLGPYFQDLPHCILSSIIVVALKGMFLQALDVPKIWRECSVHGLTWIVTFLSTVVLDIEYGLGIGLAVSLVTLIWRSNKAEIYILGRYEDYDIYIDTKTCDEAKEIPGMKIIKYSGSLNFATIDYFLTFVNNVMISSEHPFKIDMGSLENISRSNCTISTVETTIAEVESNEESTKENEEKAVKWIILDLSSAGSVDPGAIKCLRKIHDKYLEKGINFVYTNCPVNVFESMIKCRFVHHAGSNRFFPTIHDAIAYCNFRDKSTMNSKAC